MEVKKSSGIGFSGLLTVAFVVLKLCHVINWSWLWVLSPLWISAIILVVLVVIAAKMPVRITTSTKRCPSCNKQVSGRGNIHRNYRFCRWCGQALDWTEPPKEET